jgi:hypothetical protein
VCCNVRDIVTDKADHRQERDWKGVCYVRQLFAELRHSVPRLHQPQLPRTPPVTELARCASSMLVTKSLEIDPLVSRCLHRDPPAPPRRAAQQHAGDQVSGDRSTGRVRLHAAARTGGLQSRRDMRASINLQQLRERGRWGVHNQAAVHSSARGLGTVATLPPCFRRWRASLQTRVRAAWQVCEQVARAEQSCKQQKDGRLFRSLLFQLISNNVRGPQRLAPLALCTADSIPRRHGYVYTHTTTCSQRFTITLHAVLHQKSVTYSVRSMLHALYLNSAEQIS